VSVTATEREQLAREALGEVAATDTVGDLLSETVEDDGVFTLRFASAMLGYPGWVWTVSLAELPDEHPTVLETELMPGDGALLAPDWVPWSERLEEYRAAQAAAGEPDETLAEREDDEDDEDDLEDDDLEEDDGIDIEAAAETSDLLAVGEDEQDEPEPEPDDGGPEPPAVTPVEDDGQEED
jgi:hypothetical protein